MTQSKPLTAAILFSGGDAPGINPLLRAFVRLGHKRHDARILGIKDGYAGLARTCDRLKRGEADLEQLWQQVGEQVGRAGIWDRGQDIVLMDNLSVSGIVDRGGIVLGSARCPEFLIGETRRGVADFLGALSVDALVVVGGEGSSRCIRACG